jgi:IS5 family transposase
MAMKQGTIIDATLISAPSVTKNKTGERDPEMHQTKKGNNWHFGMKVHIGVDKDSSLIHSVETNSVNVHDITRAAQLLHGEEEVVYGDLAIKELRSVRKWLTKAQHFGLP